MKFSAFIERQKDIIGGVSRRDMRRPQEGLRGAGKAERRVLCAEEYTAAQLRVEQLLKELSQIKGLNVRERCAAC